MKTIYLAGGCFWGVEKFLESAKGVVETEIGYANGPYLNPTYEEVRYKQTGHAETVKVIYDETPPHKMIGFIVPNKASQKNIKSYALTVAEVEDATGLKFFSKLPVGEQKRLKSKIDLDEWSFK